MIHLELVSFAEVAVGQVFREENNLTGPLYRKDTKNTAIRKIEGVEFSQIFDQDDLVFARMREMA